MKKFSDNKENSVENGSSETHASLFYLIGLEYKKMWKKKVTWISTGCLLVFILFMGAITLVGQKYYEGESIGTTYEWMKKEKTAVQALAGTVMDDDFLNDASEALRATESGTYNSAKEFSEAYAKNELPYKPFLESISEMEVRRVDLDFSGYYQKHDDYLREYYGIGTSEENVEILIEMGKESQPYTYGWFKGYGEFIQSRRMMNVFTTLVVAICLAGMFAGEASSRMDALMCSCRYGKK